MRSIQTAELEQKFELGVRSSTDPVNLLAIGVFAGIQQADNSFSGYGQGAAGYGKRFAGVELRQPGLLYDDQQGDDAAMLFGRRIRAISTREPAR